MKHYTKGKPIESLDEFCKQDLIFFYERLVHKGWFQSWQLSFILRHLHNGAICYADKTKTDKGVE